MATDTMQPGDCIPMPWDEHEALSPGRDTLEIGPAEVTFDPADLPG